MKISCKKCPHVKYRICPFPACPEMSNDDMQKEALLLILAIILFIAVLIIGGMGLAHWANDIPPAAF